MGVYYFVFSQRYFFVYWVFQIDEFRGVASINMITTDFNPLKRA